MGMPPAPPMDPGMGDPGMGEEDPMMGGDDQGMGDDDMGMPPAPQDNGDDELMQVIDGLSMEDKAAVLKYAKSMSSDDNAGGEQQQPMPNESVMVRTTMGEMLGSTTLPRKERKTERKETKLPKKFNKSNPFVSPYN